MEWSTTKNLRLNQAKSKEVIFSRKRLNHQDFPDGLKDIPRHSDLNILGVKISQKINIHEHISHIINKAHKNLYALKILKSYGLMLTQVHTIFIATVLSRILYGIQAWWGLANLEDRKRLEIFLKKCKRWKYCSDGLLTLDSLVEKGDDKLFNDILNADHVLNRYLPDRNSLENHRLRHNRLFQLPTLNNHNQYNFTFRMIHKQLP